MANFLNKDNKELLLNVFENEEQIALLSVKEKIEIARSLKGHKKENCKQMCPHLLRVMRIRWKSKGVPYPIKKLLFKSID